MFRMLLYLAVCLGGFNAGRRLWPTLATRRGAVVFWAITALGFAAWLVPYVMGHRTFGRGGPFGTWLQLTSAAWLVAAVLLMLVGTAILVLHRTVSGIRRLIRLHSPEPEQIDDQRRGLLLKAGRAVPLTALSVGLGGVVKASESFAIKRADVKIRGLPSGLDGFRIGQITDIHVGAFIDAALVRRAVDAMNAERVDLQVMTGDLIDDLEQLDATFDALQQCRATHGMLAILGNHEHWRGLDRIVPRYRAITAQGGPVRLLIDESTLLHHKGTKLRVVGTDYPMAMFGAREQVMEKQAEVAFSQASPDETVICLAHHPDFFPYAASRGARLTLSGHTHGGQVAVLGYPAFRFAFKYMLGWYRHGEHQLYVSGGTGHWLPFRIGVPTEVTILTLRAV